MELRKHINKLLEKKGDTYEKGAVMLYFSFPELLHIHDSIMPGDLYTEEDEDRSYGYEDEAHTTLLYGVGPDVEVRDIENIVTGYTFGTCKLHNASLFTTNPNYDVLKFDVEGEPLHQVHQELKSIPYESDFPNFHPHLTIAYIQKGLGQKYASIIKKKYQEILLVPQYIVYSAGDGSQNKINIRID